TSSGVRSRSARSRRSRCSPTCSRYCAPTPAPRSPTRVSRRSRSSRASIRAPSSCSARWPRYWTRSPAARTPRSSASRPRQPTSSSAPARGRSDGAARPRPRVGRGMGRGIDAVRHLGCAAYRAHVEGADAMQAGSEGGVAGYGWLPDPPDPRDKRIDDLALPTTPPPALDWQRAKAAVREVLNQGPEPACVGYAIAGAIRASLALAGLPDFAPSPRAIWYWARASQGREGEYSGTTIRAGMKAIAQLGLVPANLHGRMVPFDKAPSFAALRAAYRYRGTRGYYRADDLDAVK